MSLASQISQEPQDEVMGESSDNKKPANRLFLNAIQKANDSTKEVRVRPEIELKELGSGRERHNRKAIRRGKKDNNREGGLNITFTNERRNVGNGRDRNRQRKQKNQDNERRDSRDSRPFAGGKRNREEKEDRTIELVKDESEMVVESPKKAKKIERCTFWPNCSKGDSCPYVHPSEPCKNFPACTYGDKCLFLHPSVPCKFGAYCTRPGCAFHHPPLPQKVPVPCKFGLNCAKGPACPFQHPHPSTRFAISTNNSTTPCKFGDNCLYKDTTCKFAHPASGTTEGEVAKLSSTLPSTPPQQQQQMDDDDLLGNEDVSVEDAADVDLEI